MAAPDETARDPSTGAEGATMSPPSGSLTFDEALALDPHTYTEDQEALLMADECDEAPWPSAEDCRFLVLQWLGAVAALEVSADA